MEQAGGKMARRWFKMAVRRLKNIRSVDRMWWIDMPATVCRRHIDRISMACRHDVDIMSILRPIASTPDLRFLPPHTKRRLSYLGSGTNVDGMSTVCRYYVDVAPTFDRCAICVSKVCRRNVVRALPFLINGIKKREPRIES